MYRLLSTAALLLITADIASAQSRWSDPYRERDEPDRRSSDNWRGPVPGNWYEERRRPTYDDRWDDRRGYRMRSWQRYFERDDDDDDDDRRTWRGNSMSPSGQKVADGGARPNISPMPPQRISFMGSYEPGTIVIDTSGKQLLLIESGGSALRYPISVGREGFSWTGTEKISRIADWPDWHPPAEMRQREPHLPEKMLGGLRNPLGARALYLGNTLYRIHGTNDASSIGQAASSGCFRMMNGHVVDLGSRVSVGASVVVVNRLPRSVAGSR
jgi:L,D-transpeptidase catalytic domain